eukprot:scaffold216488_cov59-Attheya_sp.AAC.1
MLRIFLLASDGTALGSWATKRFECHSSSDRKTDKLGSALLGVMSLKDGHEPVHLRNVVQFHGPWSGFTVKQIFAFFYERHYCDCGSFCLLI